MERAKISDLNALPELDCDFVSQALRNDLIDIDGAFPAVNFGIRLRLAHRDGDAEMVFRKTLVIFPGDILAHYELALLLASRGDFSQATLHALVSVKAHPLNFNFVAAAATLLSIRGESGAAITIIDKLQPSSSLERDAIRALAQATRFIGKWPYHRVIASLDERHEAPRFLTTNQVAQKLEAAIESDTPFSLVRLGDGEGAWSLRPNSEEAEYSDLFREMRRSFLIDWFRDDVLLDDDGFHRFAQAVTSDVESCDVIGIPEIRRMRGEFNHLSRRGIPSCINLLKNLGLLDSPLNISSTEARFCSANIHIDLNDNRFFERVFSTGKPIGVITSYRNLPDVLRFRGANIVRSHFVPGDSRNIWKTGDGVISCQYPSFFERIKGELENTSLEGNIYLIAAGYVGKRYGALVKNKGGIAIDIGAVANKWADSNS